LKGTTLARAGGKKWSRTLILLGSKNSEGLGVEPHALAVHPDLISGWTLLREWGRIGSPGRVVIEPFHDEMEATKAGAKIEATKKRRGYRPQINRIAEAPPLPRN
jgi:predicted DNA-binding WGR domain protein